MSKTTVIAVANQKGGVAKSTSAFCIGVGLVRAGKKVLLVDVDPQADLTKMLGERAPHELPITLSTLMNDIVSDVDTSGSRADAAILHHAEGLDYIPSNRSLSTIEINLINVIARETVLRRLLDGIKSNYDYVILDCRPSLGMLVINALSAADQVLIPVQADYLAAEGLTELIGTVQSIKRQINPTLTVGGVFLTMANETNFRKDIVSSVKQSYGKVVPVFDAVIPSTVRLAEISTANHSIYLHDPKGKAAEAYKQLTQEVIRNGNS